jgi:hypothetical protein
MIFGRVTFGILIVILSWNVGLCADVDEQPLTTDPVDCQAGLRFAVIGDFGHAGRSEADVATLVHSWDVELIVTTGDNNYPDGEAETIDENIGQYYSDYIYPYQGEYGPGAGENRFFPTLGNHDWRVASLQPHHDYFTLPGNERYSDFKWGPVHFFIVDSDPHEPDGRTQDSVQAAWLKERLTHSSTPWQLVFMHHPPYSSSAKYGSDDEMQWPFAAWGADAVLAGHAHLYERLHDGEIPFFVNGLGGRRGFLLRRHRFGSPAEYSQVRYNREFGAQLVTAGETCINFSFYNRRGDLIDSYTLRK